MSGGPIEVKTLLAAPGRLRPVKQPAFGGLLAEERIVSCFSGCLGEW